MHDFFKFIYVLLKTTAPSHHPNLKFWIMAPCFRLVIVSVMRTQAEKKVPELSRFPSFWWYHEVGEKAKQTKKKGGESSMKQSGKQGKQHI
jgi:hypothetical protein